MLSLLGIYYVMNQVSLDISFRRALVGDKMTAWNNLVAKISAYLGLAQTWQFDSTVYVSVVPYKSGYTLW